MRSITAKRIDRELSGWTYYLDPKELCELLRSRPPIEVMILNEAGKELRSFNTADFQGLLVALTKQVSS